MVFSVFKQLLERTFDYLQVKVSPVKQGDKLRRRVSGNHSPSYRKFLSVEPLLPIPFVTDFTHCNGRNATVCANSAVELLSKV